MKKLKKMIAILLVCVMVTGCSANRENSNGSVAEDTSVSETESSRAETSSAQSSSVASSVTSKTTSEMSSASSTSAVSSSASSTVSKNDNTSNLTTSKDSTSEEISAASSSTTSSAPVEVKPTWKEETIDDTTMFVNTQGIYSRRNAVVGSEAVKLYNLNDKVTIVAKTDTDYYKLEDGSFIHKDYLSDKETPKPVESQKPSKPSAQTGSISADVATLLNNAPLNPMITNEPETDGMIADILKKTTNDDMTTAQKVTAVYDYIINNYSYNYAMTGGVGNFKLYTSDMNYHSMRDAQIRIQAYSMLKQGKGVCDHYAALFMILTRRIGLESYTVNGQVQSSRGGTTGHVWVIIKLNGQYYTFDPQIEQRNLVNGQIAYNFFCKPESAMSNFYTYGTTFDMMWTQLYCEYGSPITADNPRDLAIACFKNFALDEGEAPYEVQG